MKWEVTAAILMYSYCKENNVKGVPVQHVVQQVTGNNNFWVLANNVQEL